MFPLPDFDVDTSDMSMFTIVKCVVFATVVAGYIFETLMSWRIDHPDETLLQVIKRQYVYIKSLRLW